MNPVLKVYEQSIDEFEQYRVKESVKIKRGWLHFLEYGYSHHRNRIAWTFRQNQERCEFLNIDHTMSSEEIEKMWKTRQFSIQLAGRNSFRKIRERDSQRAKVYKWENSTHIKIAKRLDQTAMLALIKQIRKDYGLKKVEVRFRSSGAKSFARGMSELAFLPCHMNNMIACHEVAHLIIHNTLGYKVAGHGPEFVAMYMELLVKYCGMDLKMLQTSATKAKVKYQ